MAQKGKEGKRFEEDIKQSFENDNLYFLRLKDSSSSYSNSDKSRFTSTNPCDFISYNIYSNKILYLECKSTNQASLPFANLKDHQLKKMVEVEEQFEHVESYCLINFRKTEHTYCIKSKFIYNFRFSQEGENTEQRKSIPEKYIQSKGELINSRKKITRFNYELKELFKNIS